jgi:hypothetical protein
MTIDELREALRDNVEAQNVCYRSDKPRQAESLALRIDERLIRCELARRGECCGWQVGFGCGCAAVRVDAWERLLAEGWHCWEAVALSTYCQRHPAVQAAKIAARAMRESGEKYEIHRLIIECNKPESIE